MSLSFQEVGQIVGQVGTIHGACYRPGVTSLRIEIMKWMMARNIYFAEYIHFDGQKFVASGDKREYVEILFIISRYDSPILMLWELYYNEVWIKCFWMLHLAHKPSGWHPGLAYASCMITGTKKYNVIWESRTLKNGWKPVILTTGVQTLTLGQDEAHGESSAGLQSSPVMVSSPLKGIPSIGEAACTSSLCV